MRNPFRYFNSSPEVIRLAVMMYVRYPLSLRQVEDLLFERGIDICHETVRFEEPFELTVMYFGDDGSDAGGKEAAHHLAEFAERLAKSAKEMAECSGPVLIPGLDSD